MRLSGVLAVVVVLLTTVLVKADEDAQIVRSVPQKTADVEQTRFDQIRERIELQPTENAETIEQIKNLGSNGVQAVIDAAKALSQNINDDIMYALLWRLKVEMTLNRPTESLIIKLTNFIGSVADARYEKVMREMSDLIRNRNYQLNSSPSKKDMFNAFGKAFNRIRNRDVFEPAIIRAQSVEAQQSSYPKNAKTFGEYLEATAAQKPDGPRFGKRDMPDTAEGFLLKATKRIRSDESRANRAAGKNKNWVENSDVELAIVAVFGREKGRMPVIVGDSGVGKSATSEMIADAITSGALLSKYPSDRFKAIFGNGNAEVIETTPARISQMALSNEDTAQAAALELFFESVRKSQANYKERTGQVKPIIVQIDNVQDFALTQMAALEQELENEIDPIAIIPTARTIPLDEKMRQATGLQKLIEKIPIAAKTPAEAELILRQTHLPIFAKNFNVTLTDDAIQAAIRTSGLVRPRSALPEAPIRMIEDMIIWSHLKDPTRAIVLNEDDVYKYVEKVTRLPVAGHDPTALQSYLSDLDTKLAARVVNQPRMVEAAISGFRRTLTGDPRKPTSMLFLGPTGTGKTLVASQLALLGYKDNARIFEINGGDLQSIDDIGSLFGDAKRAGKLMQWFDDPCGGLFGGVILWNEVDKMHPAVFERVMEFIDRGVLTSGHDGNTRVANRHTVIMTSNHGAKKLFPDSVASWSEAEVEARLKNMDEDAVRAMLQQVDSDGSVAKNLKPEIVGRINHVAIAGPIITSRQPEIAATEITDNAARIQNDIGVSVTVVDPRLAEKLGMAPGVKLFGGRAIREQVKRYIDKAIEQAQKQWPLIKRGDEIKLGLEVVEFGTDKITIEYAGQKISIDAPMTNEAHPLSDPKVRQMLADLPGVMHAHIVEQDEAVDILVRAVQAKFADPNRQRPVSFMAIGRTGLGKTEIAKALAQALYGSADRHASIEMGKIGTAHDWETIFEPMFEQFLANNPDGGVLILDEISNLGGSSKADRIALFKKLYALKDEGVWTTRGKPPQRFDLRKYIIIDTGNDLEKLMQNATSEDELTSIWQENKSRSRIVELLHDEGKGVPEPYLARQDAIVMLKPFVRSGKVRVTKRILESVINERVLKLHAGLKITWSDSFNEAMALAFFSQSGGARSVRVAVENEVVSLISAELMKVQYDAKKISQMNLVLSLTDNLPATPFLKADQTNFERQVILKVSSMQGAREIDSATSDVTVMSEKVIIPSEEEARQSAIRSAARAIANEASLTGLRLAHMSVRARTMKGQASIGYDRYVPLTQIDKAVTRKTAIARMAIIWAGRLAVEKAGGDPDAQGSSDNAEMEKIFAEYYKSFGTAENMNIGRPGSAAVEPKSEAQTKKAMFTEAYQVADAHVEEKWLLISHVADSLVANGDFTAEQFKTLAGTDVPASCKMFLIKP